MSALAKSCAWTTSCVRKLRLSLKLALCQKVLAHLGDGVYIHPSVTFNWPERIHVSDGCRLHQGAILNARTSHDVGIMLGKGVTIHEYTYVDPYGGWIRIEEGAGIGHHCVVGGHGGLTIGRHTMISGLTYIVPANHIFQRLDVPYLQQGETRQGIVIGNNVWIGAGCIILDGVTIGDNCVVGAGSIVTRSLPACVLAYGAPAKVMTCLSERGDTSAGDTEVDT